MKLFGRPAQWNSARLGLLLALGACTASQTPATTTPPADILLLGCNHLTQLYKADQPASDVLTPRRQTELAQARAGLLRYRPEAIMVEVLPERQPQIDSLYQLYRQDKLDLSTLPDGRSEVYQLGFALGKQLGLPRILCVNAPGGTSQSILHEGKNIELYQEGTTRLREVVRPVDQEFVAGSLTLPQYLRRLNDPALLRQLHTLVYRTPARVTDGRLKPDPMVDAAFINPHYVGAEFISVFYNRDLKIYSNIVTAPLVARPQRTLLLIGARHVTSLQGIFRTDPAYRVVEAKPYLGRD
ncbi:DUF5694 domain-containing protein [Hymenobacter sp. ASUV-10]|uniref:DUF5694 domain-containing protein n=1 Tax=Hymenobacter aranciens TaxID=3063996 RepID=A0ABT9B5D2_9BACT|nr:DUF5694 domain-containing protein [Hymenobacter sp. ASUV-10]MDO7873465.1 DUF5694 domain-containing protein [Hymenobacter sp. ASUV-10]